MENWPIFSLLAKTVLAIQTFQLCMPNGSKGPFKRSGGFLNVFSLHFTGLPLRIQIFKFFLILRSKGFIR